MGFRYYKDDKGNQYPRVTSICGQLEKPALTYWAANCACDYILEHLGGIEIGGSAWDTVITLWPKPDKILEIIEKARKEFRSVSKKALDVGSQVHAAIEHYLKTGEEPKEPSDQVLSGFLAFLEWKDEHLIKVYETEKTVYGQNWAGTLDLIADLKFGDKIERYTVDFKTSKKPTGSDAKLGYPEWLWQVSAYTEITKTPGMGILRLDKDTGYPDWYDLTQHLASGREIFYVLVELWYLRNPKFERNMQKENNYGTQ